MAQAPAPGTASVVRRTTACPPAVAPGPTPLRVEFDRSYVAHDRGRRYAVEIVRVVGEVDLTTVPLLASALSGLVVGPVPRVVVDTAGMTFCGLRGLTALHDGARLADAQGTGFVVAALSPHLSRLSSVLWPDARLDLSPDRTCAVGWLVAAAWHAADPVGRPVVG